MLSLGNSPALESVRMSDGKLNMIMVKIGGSFSSLPRTHILILSHQPILARKVKVEAEQILHENYLDPGKSKYCYCEPCKSSITYYVIAS
jgi:hypothetical protein